MVGLCVSKRIHKAIFEREQLPADNFGASVSTWCEVAREWVGLKTLQLDPKGEFVDANQTKALTRYTVDCCWSRTMDAVDASCRMKLARDSVVDETEPKADANFRIFHISDIVNVNEMNRELQMLVVEKV